MTLVTFDLDGVLQHNPFGGYVFPALARKISPYVRDDQHLSNLLGFELKSPAPHEIKIPGLNTKEREIVAAIYAQTTECLKHGQLRDAYDWDAAAIAIARAVGCHEPLDVTELVKEGCRQGHISAFTGAAQVLHDLTKAGAIVVAVSNGFTRYQRPVLDALGLTQYFSAIVSPEETGTAKPDPLIFQAARQAVGVASTEAAYHVGDTLIHDIAGAKAAGMFALWMQTKLPANMVSYSPTKRPRHPQFLPSITDIASREFASGLYGYTTEQLMPDAVVCNLREVIPTLEELGASLPDSSDRVG